MSKNRKPVAAQNDNAISKKSRQERYAPLYLSMTTDPAWIALRPTARLLYTECCLMQRAQPGHIGCPGKDNPYDSKYQRNDVFYMNWAMVREHGIYGKNKAAFYDDIKALIAAGFIDCLYNGRYQRKKSVYQLSARWWEEERKAANKAVGRL